jgi:DNA-binding NarL/FixJ family response regulator
VARLAAEGMTNREVAETLVVSEKTIETHLAAAFRKLGIAARGQLATALAHPEDA